MAIDRNIIEWSQDDKAFKAKSYVEIFNMLLENYRAIYGQDIDLTVETAFGEELRMEAEQLYDFAKLAEDVYYTLDVNNAKGAILDNLVAFTSNLIRKTNIQTILTGSLKIQDINGDGPISLSAGNTVYLQDEFNILWRVESTNGATQLVVGATLGTAVANSVRLTCASFGENLIPGSITQIQVNGSYYSNSLLLDTIIYEQIGSIEETDEMLRQRKNNTLSYNSIALLDSIRDYILKNIFSIKDVVIYNANGRTTGDTNTDSQGNTVLPLALNDDSVENVTLLKHDLLVIVQPQTGISEQNYALSSFFEVTVSDTAPSSPSAGDKWYDTANSLLKEYESSTWSTITSWSSPTTAFVPTKLSLAIAEVLKNKITPGIATAAELLSTTPDGQNGFDPVTDDTGYIEVTLTETVGSQEYNERYNFYVANKYSPLITIELLTKNNYDSVSSQLRIRNALYKLSTEYVINEDINLDELFAAVRSANLDLNNPTFTITGITIGGGTPGELKARNGYWLVDKTLESGLGLADWNIVISEN